jgi:NAD(P)-dependent dehydrogenase (short-subunit alcohol dehydrogenase family)
MMGINLSGVMYCMRAQLAHIPKPGGSIVNVASTAGLHGLPKSAAYSASKHGVIGLTASAAGEFGRAGVRINSVCPWVFSPL